LAELEFTIFSELKDHLKSKDLEFNVRSDSMLPLLKAGDIIKVSELPEALNQFDIIVFKGQEKKLLVHYIWRIVRSHQDQEITYLTRGINNNFSDYPIKKEDILGLVNNYTITNFRKLRIVLKLWLKRKISNA
jgi:signal peptidase I